MRTCQAALERSAVDANFRARFMCELAGWGERFGITATMTRDLAAALSEDRAAQQEDRPAQQHMPLTLPQEGSAASTAGQPPKPPPAAASVGAAPTGAAEEQGSLPSVVQARLSGWKPAPQAFVPLQVQYRHACVGPVAAAWEGGCLPAAVFSCTSATWAECLQRQLVGAPASGRMAKVAPRISPLGTLLFLHIVDRECLQGGWLAGAAPGMDLQPEAWAKSGASVGTGQGSSGSPFPLQVPLAPVPGLPDCLLPPLPWPVWRHVFRGTRSSRAGKVRPDVPRTLDAEQAAWLLSASVYYLEHSEALARASLEGGEHSAT